MSIVCHLDGSCESVGRLYNYAIRRLIDVHIAIVASIQPSPRKPSAYAERYCCYYHNDNAHTPIVSLAVAAVVILIVIAVLAIAVC